MSTGSGRFLLILHDAKDGTESGRAELRAKLSSLLHLSPSALNAVFNSLPVIIKYDLSAEQSERFVQFFESVGAEVEALEGHPGRSLPAPGQPELAILESPEVKFALAMLLDGPPDRKEPAQAPATIETLTLNEDAGVEDLERLLDDALLETDDTIDVSVDDSKSVTSEPLGVSLEELTRMLEMEDALPPPSATPVAPPANESMSLAFDEETSAERPDVRSILLDEPVEKLESPISAPPPERPIEAAEPRPSSEQKSVEADPVHLPQLRKGPDTPPPPQESPHLPQPFAFGAPPPIDADDEEEEEDDDEDEDPNWYAIPKNRQLFFGAAIVAVFMLLLGVNKYLLSSTEEMITLTLTPEALNALLKEQRSILDRSGGEEVPKNRFSWSGEATQDRTSSRITLIEQNGVPISVDLTIRQQEAPKRSLKEVADGVPPPVWIRLCLAQNLQVSAGEEPGTVLFHGQAKAYFSDEERNARAVVAVKGKVWREYDRYVGSWNISLNSDSSPEQPEYILEREKHEYIVRLSGTFIAKERTKILRERLAPGRSQRKSERAIEGEGNEGEAVDGEAPRETER